MKKVLAMLLALAMVFSLAACGGGSSSDSSSSDTSSSSDSSADSSSEDTSSEEFQDARSLQTEEQAAWNDMTEEELYEQAKEEGGEIVIYGVSSRMEKVCDLFNEAFPGLTAVAYDLDQSEVIAKIRTEAQNGIVNADVMQCTDVAGEIFYDFVPENYVDLYFPTDICETIVDDAMLNYGMPFYTTLPYWYYNTDLYPDAEPITNWWQFVEKNEDGSQKYSIVCKEIGTEQTYLALLASFIVYSDEMEQAYEDLYGEPLEYTYDPSEITQFEMPAENAGYEFIYRFSQQEMTFISDGDEIVQAVDAGINGRPTFGLASAGKISGRDDDGLAIAWLTGLTPYNGIQNCSYVYPIAGCDNPAGARLFVRYMMGDGFEAMCKEGNWSVVSTFTNEKNPFPIEEANAITPDMKKIYDVFLDAQDTWTYWLNKNENM